MSIIEAIILGVVQGLTEFIPVSSSGHLLILHDALGLQASGLTFDVALHVGTLLALVIFFYKDIAALAHALVYKNDHTRLAWLLAAATVPAAIAGVLLEEAAESSFRSVKLVSMTLIVVGLLMLMAEKFSARRRKKTELTDVGWRQGILIGLAQAVAIIPGVSRSGSTITAGLFTGLDRVAATRFSFLLAIPITFGAVLKVLLSSEGLHQLDRSPDLFAIGIAAAFFSGIFAIRFLLKFLSKRSLAVFAYYRVALGLLVLLVI